MYREYFIIGTYLRYFAIKHRGRSVYKFDIKYDEFNR